MIGLATACVVVGGLLSTPAESATDQPTRKIAFASDRDGTWQIYVMNADGTGEQTPLTSDPSGAVEPSFSADGTKIAFGSSRDDNREIYVMNADGTGQPQRLTSDPGYDQDPSFSGDGTKIAFGSSRDGDAEIYVMNADGTGQPQQLTSNSTQDFDPSFSPDGTKIAFTSYRDGNYEIYVNVMNANGTSTQTRLTNVTAQDFSPAFSPDGTKIAFASSRDRYTQIYVMNADGTGEQTPLTNDPAGAMQPSFSPDGTKIAFTSYRDVNEEIYVMNADGSGQPQRLTSDPGNDRWPSFGGSAEPTDFDWTVPERFGEDGDGDGLIDSFPPDANGELEVEPDGWRVDFDADQPGEPCDTTLERTWLLDGVDIETDDPNVIAYDPHSCDFSYRFDEEGTYPISLEVKDEDDNLVAFVTKDVVVQDWLIVSIGDSVASGEGNPDIPFLPVWQNRQCHRSALAGPARAALAVEDADPRTSVTFVHLACSGATTLAGLLGPYEGQEPGVMLPPQVDELVRLAGGREIDAALVSIGANDVRFSKIVEKCLIFRDCHLVGPGSAASQFERDIVRLPGNYDLLAAALAEREIAADRVYLTEYFDPTRDDKRHACDNGILDDFPIAGRRTFGITAAEAEWASNSMMLRLNTEGADASLRHGWNRVGGILDPFRAHGYCANDHWVVRYAESMPRQGNKDGSLHPNAPGHELYGQRIAAELAMDLYTGGDLDSPRPPAEAAP